MKTRSVIIAVAIGLAGCATIGRPFDESKISRFEIGRTTEADVVAALGQPTVVTSGSGMHVMSYSYTHAQARPASFIPFIGPLVGGTDASSTAVAFLFTHEGVLQSSTRSGVNMRTGGI
jgi:hypothetical protein